MVMILESFGVDGVGYDENEGAQMSNELESDIAMVMNLESFGIDGVGYDETETEPPT